MPRLQVLFVASECVPFAKTGGLADVVGALPPALAARGHDVRVVMPRYRVAKKHPARPLEGPLVVPVGAGHAVCAVYESRLPKPAAVEEPGANPVRVYLLEHDVFFDRDGLYNDKQGDFGDNLGRFTLLSRGALELCKALDFTPDVIHVHDWMTSLLPVYLDTVEARGPLGRAATVLSIHNMGYQGWFGADDFWWTGLPGRVLREGSLGEGGALNLLRGGLLHSTVNSTVSPTYAKEVMGRSGGAGLDWVFRARGEPVVGILNGIDDDAWNPASDPYTVAPFDKSDLTGKAACKAALQAELGLPVRPDVPLFGIVSRLVAQKGIDLIAGALERLLSLDVQLAVCGSGEKWMEELLARAGRMTGRVGAFFGMNEGLAHRIEAGADLFLMPSKYEPCGLNQMYSQRYGTLPVVRAVGGLDDTVDNFATGFKFWDDSADALAQCAAWAVHVYRHDPAHFRAMQLRAMDKPMGWSHACKQYEALYRLAMRRRAGRG